MNLTVYRTVLSHLWTEISKQMHIFFVKIYPNIAYTCMFLKKKSSEFLSAKFDLSILSHGGQIKTNKKAYRTVLSHLWTKIFPQIANMFLKKKASNFLSANFDISILQEAR